MIRESFETPEKKILAAARKVFLKKGFKGASMVDIAQTAGISRTSLNYYFRTKERLFNAIFKEIVKSIMPKLADILKGEAPFADKLKLVIDAHCETLLANSPMPLFMVNFLNDSPSKFMATTIEILGRNNPIAEFVRQMKQAYNMTHSQVARFFSLYSGLMIMPFLIKDMIETVSCEKFETFVLDRKPAVYAALKNFLETL